MTEVLLVRHGETLWNTEGRIQGHLDSPLSSAGVAQAEVLARRLAAERPDGLYTSDLGRALQTAEPIACATGLVPQVDPKLRERSYGRFEGRIWSEIKSEFRGDRDAHWDHTSRVKAVGGESVREFRDRVLSALDRRRTRWGARDALSPGHGNPAGGATELCDAQRGRQPVSIRVRRLVAARLGRSVALRSGGARVVCR